MGAHTFGMCNPLIETTNRRHRDLCNLAVTYVLYLLETNHRTFSLTEFTAELNKALQGIPEAADISFTVESTLVLWDGLVDAEKVERIGGHVRFITAGSP